MARIPRKLKNDPIVEALFEMRFSSSDIAEIVLGKLASNEAWKGFASQRLPLADLPASIREKDPALVHQAVLQLQNTEGTRVVKIGPRVLSYHALKPYPGWATFEPELSSCYDYLFKTLTSVRVTRFGFRYINVLKEEHLIRSLSDLNYEVRLGGEPLASPLNLNFVRSHGPMHNATVRIASKEMVTNPTPGLVGLIDVDIFTLEDTELPAAKSAGEWVDSAHNFLKEEFFTLLPDKLIDRLEEK